MSTAKRDLETGRRGSADAHVRQGTRQGLYLYGVARSRSWRAGARREDVIRVRYRDLEALVRPVPFRLPDRSPEQVKKHQRTVDGAMQRGTILPAPFGMVFRGRRSVIRFLEDQYIVLDEGLAFIDGHWELRLHVGQKHGDREVAQHLYSDLRRFARAAIPLPAEEGQVLSAAFLVERGGWIEFVERADDLGADHADLELDVTGPWPPYDFVRIVP